MRLAFYFMLLTFRLQNGHYPPHMQPPQRAAGGGGEGGNGNGGGGNPLYPNGHAIPIIEFPEGN